ncbi:hypothetical protein [Robiginitalea marina]|uniref:Uncharacterized protein n=1 Tax=Robiginitalea marina TaxID=2954105 RepID=A0ABT1AWX0_9FLAO|nr:hypothetical protein [Robiginitalea marina]MCO5724085.1 hypothetical protein [Robiginitalea marina]
MLLFLGILAFLLLINILLLVFSNSLRWTPAKKGPESRSEAPGPQVYSIGNLDSKYQEAV